MNGPGSKDGLLTLCSYLAVDIVLPSGKHRNHNRSNLDIEFSRHTQTFTKGPSVLLVDSFF
jgi:hypothetical protein